jgi:hypothetical protein
MADELSLNERVLLAALALERGGQPCFTTATLAVTAWQAAPAAFGLPGFVELHPDSNKVVSVVVGAKGLAKGKGWLRKAGPKLYGLTREGRDRAAALLGGAPPGLPPASLGGPEAELLARLPASLLARLLASRAAELYGAGRQAEVSFKHACLFWRLGEGDRGPHVQARLDAVADGLRAAAEAVEPADGVLPGGRHVGAADVRFLSNLHRYLADRFERHLRLLGGAPRPARAAAR